MSHAFHKLHRSWLHQQAMLDTLTKLFIVGCGKSGTTWLVNTLNGHEHVVVRGEGCFAYQLAPAMQQAFAHFNKHQTSYKKDPASILQNHDMVFLCRTAIDALLAHYVQASQRDLMTLRVIGDKTPQHAVNLELLAQIYPEGKFIHIIRDPRDAAVSGWFHQGESSGKTMDQFAEHFITQVWPLHVGNAKQTGAKLGPASYLELRYEDLHGHEAGHVKTMLEFIGVDAGLGQVQRCVEAGSFKKLSGGRDRGSESRNAFYRKGVIGDWVNHLSPEVAQKSCAAVASLMEACGYDPDCRVLSRAAA
jgi:hypothetical protein